MKILALLALLLPSAASASTTYTDTWNVSTTIPDNDDAGYSDTRDLGIPADSQVVVVTVELTFVGGWNGDLFAYLIHDSGYSVLLNRVGKSAAAPDGAGSSGLNITLDDIAASDIHTAIPMTGGSVSVVYQPDARTTDPLSVLDTDPRTAFLSTFNGLDASGTWTLFVADQSAGDTSILQSWGLSVTVVPEPSAAILAAFGFCALFRRNREPRNSPHAPSRQHNG